MGWNSVAEGNPQTEEQEVWLRTEDNDIHRGLYRTGKQYMRKVNLGWVICRCITHWHEPSEQPPEYP